MNRQRTAAPSRAAQSERKTAEGETINTTASLSSLKRAYVGEFMRQKRLIVTLLAVTLFLIGVTLRAQEPRAPRLVSPASKEDLEAQIFHITNAPAFESSPEPEATQTSEHWEARDLIANGQWEEARRLIKEALAISPGDRTLHRQLAELNWYFYQERGKRPEDLKGARQEALAALELGFEAGEVDHYLTWLLAHIFGQTKEVGALERVFTEALALESSAPVYLDYARGLSLLKDKRAESVFRESLRIQPQGNPALLELGEWLLDHGREAEVPSLLEREKFNYYAHFLRAVAFERLGQEEEAQREYLNFSEFSKSYPGPERFRIPGSRLQEESGIRFGRAQIPIQSENENGLKTVSAAITYDQMTVGFSSLIYREAGGEPRGGQRGVAWEVRNRVLRGSVLLGPGGKSCPYVVNSGSTTVDRYKSVMCQSGQFEGVCLAWCSNPTVTSTSTCPRNGMTDAVAYDAFYGYAPDPIGQHCPGGITNWGGSYCSENTRCKGGASSFKLIGAVFNLGRSISQQCENICAPMNRGRMCADSSNPNNKLDNCFYSNPFWDGPSESGYLARTGSGNVHPGGSYYYSGTSKTHKAHLEGIESADFDLYLYKWNSSTSKWDVVSRSQRFSSVEDITYSSGSGYYAWGVTSYSGSGGYTLYRSPN